MKSGKLYSKKGLFKEKDTEGRFSVSLFQKFLHKRHRGTVLLSPYPKFPKKAIGFQLETYLYYGHRGTQRDGSLRDTEGRFSCLLTQNSLRHRGTVLCVSFSKVFAHNHQRRIKDEVFNGIFSITIFQHCMICRY